MKKWLRNVLCVVLVFAMVVAVIAPVAKAGENTNAKSSVIPITFTEIVAAHTNSEALTVKTNVTFTEYGVADNMTQLAWCYPTVGTATSNGVKEVAAYPWSGTWVYFSNAFAGTSGPTYFKIAKDTTFTWNGQKFKVTEDFEITNDGTGWKVTSQQIPQETKADVTISGFWGGSATEVYLRTNLGSSHTFAENRFTTSDITVTRGTEERNISSFYLFGAEGGSIHLSHEYQAGDILKIKAGGTAVNQDKLYTITFKNDYALKYDGTKWEKYQEPTAQPIEADVTVSGIYFQAGADLFLTTNLNVNHEFTGIRFTTSNITVTKGNHSTEQIVSFSIHPDGTTNTLCMGYAPSQGDILTIKKDGTAVNEQKQYTIHFANEFKLQYNGTSWEKYEEPVVQPTEEDVTVSGIYFQAGTDLFLTTDLSSSHKFSGVKFLTSDITITKSDKSTVAISKFTIHLAENTINTIPIGYEADEGDVLTIRKDGTAVNEEKKYKIVFANELKLEYDGTKWVKYEEPAPQPPVPVEPTYTDVTVQGVVLQTKDFVYLNVGLTSGNANYLTQSVVVTNSAGVETKIEGIALESGNLFIPLTATKGDILKIAKDGTAVDSKQAVGLKFLKEYALQYNGTKWETYVDPNASAKYSYVDVSLSSIYVQGGNDLYLTTGMADSHKYKGLKFTTSDIIVYKPNGSTDKVANVTMHPDSGKLYVAFGYPVEEGLGIQIPQGAIAVNVTKECGIKFTSDFSLFYTNGKWVVDNNAPIITYRGEELIAGNQYGLRLGMTQSEVEGLFAAEDVIQAKKAVVFTYPSNMFGADGKLQPGTFELKVSASDNSGNVAEYAIKVKGYTKDAPTITFVGEAEREFDAGKKFDTASLKAVAKDGNGKKLSVKFSYSEGARNSDGTMKQGSHKLYLTATDDEGQQFVKAITLNCYDYTYLKVTGFYYFLNDELYISTNMKNPEPFKGAWLTSDNLLINDESGAIPWVAVDQNTGSLYVVCKKEAGDVMTIAEGATFVDDKNYVGIKVENQFKAHTDGIGWIVDRIPRGRRGNVSSPATGDNSMWIVYAGVCVLAVTTSFVVYNKKKKQS